MPYISLTYETMCLNSTLSVCCISLGCSAKIWRVAFTKATFQRLDQGIHVWDIDGAAIVLLNPTFGRWTWHAHRRGIVKSRPCMVKLAVFLENWPCKTRLHGSLAKPLIQDNIAPPAFFSADAHEQEYLYLKTFQTI